MQNTNIMPGFNDAVFDALRVKVQTMDPEDRCISLIFDEMALKSALVYNHGLDRIEGFEDIGEPSLYGERTVHKVETTSWFLPYNWYS